jgi:hypothetical protein
VELDRCLTTTQIHRYFPEYEQRLQFDALPEPQRLTALLSMLDSDDGVLSREEAERRLGRMGAAALPNLIARLARPHRAWRAAKMLADIGLADDTVVDALEAALLRWEGSDQYWIAAALARLGRLDAVLAQAQHLPEDVVAGAVAAPYGPFRDHAIAHPPLDYRPLAAVLDGFPQYVAAVTEKLGPGRGDCTITPDEVDEALAGLTAPHVVIRWHAASALGNWCLGAAAAERILPALAERVAHDPDPDVRRLARLSLSAWHSAADPYLTPA